MQNRDTKHLRELPPGSTFTLYARRGNEVATIEGESISLNAADLEKVKSSLKHKYDFMVAGVTKHDGYVILYNVDDIKYSIIAYDSVANRTYEWNNVYVFRYSLGNKNVDLFVTTEIGHKIDRRYAYRVPVNKSCVISLGDHKGTLNGEAVDLSTTGILVRVLEKDCRLDVGDNISIHFIDNPSDNPEALPIIIKLSARIVRIHCTSAKGSTSYGCVLTAFDDRKLHHYIAQKQMASIKRSNKF